MANINLLRDGSGLAAKKHQKNNTLVFVIGGNFKEVVGEERSIGMDERHLLSWGTLEISLQPGRVVRKWEAWLAEETRQVVSRDLKGIEENTGGSVYGSWLYFWCGDVIHHSSDYAVSTQFSQRAHFQHCTDPLLKGLQEAFLSALCNSYPEYVLINETKGKNRISI